MPQQNIRVWTPRNPVQSFWSSALVFALGVSAFEPLQPMAKSRVAMLQVVRAFLLIRNCRWKCGKVRVVGKFLAIKKTDLFTASFDTTIQLSLRMHPINTRAVFAKLNHLVIPWSTIKKRSKVPYLQRGLTFGALENPKIHEWISMPSYGIKT